MCSTNIVKHFLVQADQFAAGLGRSADLGQALIKLNNDNLGFPIYDWLFSVSRLRCIYFSVFNQHLKAKSTSKCTIHWFYQLDGIHKLKAALYL
jgi:hypothetical protein